MKSTEWNSKDCNPTEDLRRISEAMIDDTGIRPPMSFQEALYWDCQQLYMMGWNSEQVVEYVKFVKGLAKKDKE